jgi:hypothetical protein
MSLATARVGSLKAFFHVPPMSALLSMLIISALLLGVIGLAAKVTLGE